MQRRWVRLVCLVALVALAACEEGDPEPVPDAAPLYPNETPALRSQIEAATEEADLPLALVQRLVATESTHRPEARNGPYYGLLQISPATARSMGFEGPAEDLLDPRTNLRYGLRYLSGAYLVAGGDPDEAIRLYQKGYYPEARAAGLLEETGLR